MEKHYTYIEVLDFGEELGICNESVLYWLSVHREIFECGMQESLDYLGRLFHNAVIKMKVRRLKRLLEECRQRERDEEQRSEN